MIPTKRRSEHSCQTDQNKEQKVVRTVDPAMNYIFLSFPALLKSSDKALERNPRSYSRVCFRGHSRSIMVCLYVCQDKTLNYLVYSLSGVGIFVTPRKVELLLRVGSWFDLNTFLYFYSNINRQQLRGLPRIVFELENPLPP